MTPPDLDPRRARLLLAGVLIAWLGGQLAWLAADERIAEGDALTNVGAVELFWEDRPGRSAAGELVRAYVQDFGEYPALFPAVTGVAARWLGVRDLDGDGPARVGLLWALAAALATWWLGRTLAGERAGLVAATALLLSPQWSALARHVMLENGVVAAVALAAAAGLAALAPPEAAPSVRRGLWAVCGAAAGGGLLVKQTAALALLPLGVVLAAAAWRHPTGSADRRGSAGRLAGPAVAAAVAAALAGPWYLRRLAASEEAGYLWRSMQANPDAVGPLHQLAFYPLVVLQQPWSPAVLAAAAGLGLAVRRGRPPTRSGDRRGLVTAVALGLLLLAVLPKKYPRLVLPLLPLAAAVVGAWLATWPAWARRSLLGVAAASWVATSLPLGPLSAALGEGRAGLVGVDERCYQDWIRPPARPGPDWGRLLGLVEEAGGPGTEYRVGAVRWPVPPCDHQTTMHLGEHLRIRVRRAGLEAYVATGSWAADGAWEEGEPDVLVGERPPCAEAPEACPRPRTEIGRVRLDHPEWPLDVGIWR